MREIFAIPSEGEQLVPLIDEDCHQLVAFATQPTKTRRYDKIFGKIILKRLAKI